VTWACALKDIKSALTERSTLVQTLSLPVNYLIMLSLFVLAGSNAPIAVVMQDHGPRAQEFVQAMDHSHSFHLDVMTRREADVQMEQGTLVAVVTIPANFDDAVGTHQPVRVTCEVNNLNQDLTDDAHRAMRLSVTSFYARAYPDVVPIVTQEQDAYRQDTDYIPFLALSIMVVALMVSGLLQSGMAAAREWEKSTIKELLLAPTPSWAILVGRMLGAFLMAIPAVVVVLAVVVFIAGDRPANLPMVVGVSLLTLAVFVAAGVALGMALKDRSTLTTLTRAIPVPLFFLSGVFGPITFSTTAVQSIARLLPIHYAIVLEQNAFKGFVTNTFPPAVNALVLGGYALLFVVLASLAMRLSRVVH
jgi:ABC-type multidrug transport system permease subunit